MTRGAAEHQHEADEQVALDEITTIDVDGPSAAANQVRDLLRQADRLDRPRRCRTRFLLTQPSARPRQTLPTKPTRLQLPTSGKRRFVLLRRSKHKRQIRDALEGQVEVPMLYRRQAALELVVQAHQGGKTGQVAPVDPVDEADREGDGRKASDGDPVRGRAVRSASRVLLEGAEGAGAGGPVDDGERDLGEHTCEVGAQQVGEDHGHVGGSFRTPRNPTHRAPAGGVPWLAATASTAGTLAEHAVDVTGPVAPVQLAGVGRHGGEERHRVGPGQQRAAVVAEHGDAGEQITRSV